MRKIFVLAVCVLIATSGFAQQTVYKKVRINMKDRTIHELVALGIPSDNLYVRPGVSVTAELSEVDLQKMQLAGFQYEVLVENMRDYYVKRNAESPRTQSTRQSCGSAVYYPTPQYFGLGSFAGFYTYDEMLAELDSMQARFPNLVSLKQVVGTHNTIEGRQIMYVKISDNPAIDEPEPEVLYTGLHHAREPASMQQLFFYMYYLLENYNTNTEIHALLDNLELYFIPCVNPDGYIYNEVNDPAGGGLWRKNVKDNGDGTFGVDINRNYGYEWGYDDAGSSPDGSSDAYRGTAGFSEPETQSMKEFVESHEFKLALNYHCYSDLLIYPWGFIEDYFTPDSLIFREFARLMTLENGYLAGTASQTVAYTGNGTSDDWMYGEQGTKPKVFAMSPEAGSMDDGFWPAINRIEELCRENVGMDLWLARFATTYAKTEDQTEAFIGDYSYFFKYNLKKLGLTDAAGFSVRVEGISGGISNAGGTNIHADPGLL
ncbi:MAG: zinc carboxypeptidase, partial [Bacteroidetes bacterium]|nr:zinc carboxypeptidase [Bacteroidota bacterium]